MIHVLHVAPSFYPAVAYGGPIFSTMAITDGVACQTNYTLKVLTTDTANPNSKARLNLPENPVLFEKGYEVQYCRSWAGTSISLSLLWNMFWQIRHADVVHLTGPYNFPVIPTLIICRLFSKPLTWSPRGGFQATAQWTEAPKRRLKTFFEKFCAKISPRNMTFHVTADIEAETCGQSFPGVPCEIIPNAVEMPESLPSRDWRTGGKLRLAFLSRVHPKKGLDILLPALSRMPPHVTLDIYGDGDPSYIETLNKEIAALDLTNRVSFKGPVTGEAKMRAFTECDIFVLPTHSENFGIVVAEALAHGTPVITTINAPWERIVTEGCGLWVEAEADALVDAITQLENSDLAELGLRGRAWVERDFSVSSMAAQFADLYQKMAGNRA